MIFLIMNDVFIMFRNKNLIFFINKRKFYGKALDNVGLQSIGITRDGKLQSLVININGIGND